MQQPSTGREAPRPHARVLIVDADRGFREALADW